MKTLVFVGQVSVLPTSLGLGIKFSRWGKIHQVTVSGAVATAPTLVGPKILSFMVKALYLQSSGRINNCQIEILFKWSNQSCTPSTAPESGVNILWVGTSGTIDVLDPTLDICNSIFVC